LQGKELDSKQTNGAQEATGATSETVAAHKTDAVDASQQQAEPEHASSQAAVMPPNGTALFAQHNPFEDAAKAEQSLSTAEVSVCAAPKTCRCEWREASGTA